MKALAPILFGFLVITSTLFGFVYASPTIQPTQSSGGYPPFYCVVYSTTNPPFFYYYYSQVPCPIPFHPPRDNPSH